MNPPHTSIPTIETIRLRLRPLTEADVGEAYLGWLEDPEIKRFLETRHQPQSLEAIRDFIATVNANPAEHLFGIFLKKDSNRHIGNIKVGPVKGAHPLADVSLLIGARDCWGKGFAREAIEAISRYAFESLGLGKLSASMYGENVGSTRAFLAAGYRQEGVRRSHYLLEGRMTDLVELGATPEDLGLRPWSALGSGSAAS